ncbi:sensor histidine kinase [Phenylobacterium deserti]|nr:HWE histidine kinase domain-containing protein [Phenylobacterium deserti]
MAGRPASEHKPELIGTEVAELLIANAREYAIMRLDDDGRILTWSPGAQLIFGFSPEDAVGELAHIFFVASDIAAKAPELELEVARREGRAENSRWHVRKDGGRFWGNGVTMRLNDEAGFVKILRDETASKLADEQRVLLLNELNHRIKNTLATVQSITEQTLRNAKVDAGTRESLTSRLMALSEAHDVLVQQNWAAADVHAIVAKALGPHAHGDGRLNADGPPLRVSPQQAVALSLALHELATNAVKHGALSTPAGQIAITWNTALDGEGHRYMNLLWQETGGPPVSQPQETGFGMRLLAKTFGHENGDAAHVDFSPEGLRCVLDLNLSSAAETPILDVDAERRR